VKFEPGELRLQLNAALFALAKYQDDQPVPLSALEGLFDRPVKLIRTVRELERGGFLLFDPYQNILRLRLKPILSALKQYAATPELFTQERPLDAALAGVERAGVFKNTILCENTHLPVRQYEEKNIAPAPPKPPDPPPDPIDNPSHVCGTLQSATIENLREFAGETFAGNLREICGTLQSATTPERDARAPRASLKEELKSCKALQEIGSLKEALLQIEHGHEHEAVDAMRSILGGVCFEGGDVDKRTGRLRQGDGGKWRTRWLTNRRKVHTVFADLISEIAEQGEPDKGRGARVEIVWGLMFGKYAQGFQKMKEAAK
jgi:hypothetical protein